VPMGAEEVLFLVRLVTTVVLWVRVLRVSLVLSINLAYLAIRLQKPAAAAWLSSSFFEWCIAWIVVWFAQIPFWYAAVSTQSTLEIYVGLRILFVAHQLVLWGILGSARAGEVPSYGVQDCLERLADECPWVVVILRLGAPPIYAWCKRSTPLFYTVPVLEQLGLPALSLPALYLADVWSTLARFVFCPRRQKLLWRFAYRTVHATVGNVAVGDVAPDECPYHDDCAICLQPLCMLSGALATVPVAARRHGVSACRVWPSRGRAAAAGLSVSRCGGAGGERSMVMRLVTLRRCGHTFHAACLCHAVTAGPSTTCPICRTSMCSEGNELTPIQEERFGGMLHAFAAGFLTLVATLLWLPIAYVMLVAAGESPQIRFGYAHTGTVGGIGERHLRPFIWLASSALEGGLSVGFFVGLVSGIFCRRLLHELSLLDGPIELEGLAPYGLEILVEVVCESFCVM